MVSEFYLALGNITLQVDAIMQLIKYHNQICRMMEGYWLILWWSASVITFVVSYSARMSNVCVSRRGNYAQPTSYCFIYYVMQVVHWLTSWKSRSSVSNILDSMVGLTASAISFSESAISRTLLKHSESSEHKQPQESHI